MKHDKLATTKKVSRNVGNWNDIGSNTFVVYIIEESSLQSVGNIYFYFFFFISKEFDTFTKTRKIR